MAAPTPDFVEVGLEVGDATGKRFNQLCYKGPDGDAANAAYVSCVSIGTAGQQAKIFMDARAYKTAIPIPN